MGDILREIEKAAQRVRRRGTRPPWNGHPRDIDMALYVADELSKHNRVLFDEHLKACTKCEKRFRSIKSRLMKAQSHGEALSIALGTSKKST